MHSTATLSDRFQISIPKSVLDEHAWKVGQKFVFIPKGKGVLLVPAPDLVDLAGIAPAGADKDAHRDRDDRY